jgi:hypothetical protein
MGADRSQNSSNGGKVFCGRGNLIQPVIKSSRSCFNPVTPFHNRMMSGKILDQRAILLRNDANHNT